MKNSHYHNQADLMIKVLPIVAQHKAFALKGGTALNFFILDMPRLSVDIDLAYLPILNRDETLSEITLLLNTIAAEITTVYGYTVLKSKLKETDYTIKLVVKNSLSQIKIEPNIIIRGAVYPTTLKNLSQKVRSTFKQDVEMQILSDADLYGGKICAALDRQHPRDLFDVFMLFQKGGLTDQTRKAFLVYLISHPRPISELLRPNFKNIHANYINSFEGMASEELGIDELIKTRAKLVKTINEGLTKKDKAFLISVSEGVGDFDLVGLKHVSHYPAVAWKILNINKMDSKKKTIEIEKLNRLFGDA